MNTTALRIAVVSLLISGWNPCAARPNEEEHDPLADYFIAPELVIEHGEQIGISADDLALIRAEIQAAHEVMPSLEEQLQEEMRKLEATVTASANNESAVLSQLDKVLDREREIKRLHITVLYRIRSQLSESQRRELMGIRAELESAHRRMQQQIQAKLHRVERLVQQRVGEGRPPLAIARLMESFEHLIHHDQPEAALAVLDEVLARLAEGSEAE